MWCLRLLKGLTKAARGVRARGLSADELEAVWRRIRVASVWRNERSPGDTGRWSEAMARAGRYARPCENKGFRVQGISCVSLIGTIYVSILSGLAWPLHPLCTTCVTIPSLLLENLRLSRNVSNKSQTNFAMNYSGTTTFAEVR